MLGIAVITYLVATVIIGLYAASMVKGAKDFMVAGRSLPLYMNFACVFATWFGAETVLSVSATFAKDGLSGISADPFGASCCLVLVAVFFARAFYRMDLLTIGDFYHKRYGKFVEVVTSVVITISYIAWTSAQLTALGLVLHVLADGTIGEGFLSLNNSIVIGASIVFIYTVFGGMWSVALTDMIQTVVIIVGLTVIAIFLGNQAGGVGHVISEASAAGKLQLFPTGGATEWFAFLAAFITVAFGSIPQQDVFQRVTSAKDERTAVTGTLLGGLFYFVFAFVPMFIAYSAIVIDPSFTGLFAAEDARSIQRILPDLILQRTPFWIQVLFFGALLSAILSTASGTLLAPASLFTENVLRPFFPNINEKNMLVVLRSVLLIFAIAATINAVTSNKTMYEMVQNAYTVTLVGAFVPLVLGIYWRQASTQGAVFSIVFGSSIWAVNYFGWSYIEYFGWGEAASFYFGWGEEAIVPAQLYGLLASFIGMIVGSLIPQFINPRIQHHSTDASGSDSRSSSRIVGH